MRENLSVVNANLAGNIGFTKDIKRQLALCLLKNLEVYKATGQAIKKAWLDTSQLDVLEEQLSEIMTGFTVAEEEAGSDKLQLLNAVNENTSFQLSKPSLKDANSRKSATSIKSPGRTKVVKI